MARAYHLFSPHTMSHHIAHQAHYYAQLCHQLQPNQQIQRDIEKWKQKACLRAKLNENNGQQSPSVDHILSQDQHIESALMLLRLLKVGEGSGKGGSTDQSNFTYFLEAFNKIATIFFTKIQTESRREFNLKLVGLLSEIIQIRPLLADIYDKITQVSSEVDYNTQAQSLFHLVKLYLMGVDTDGQHAIRIVMHLTARLLATHSS